jgi:hypothetical protein
LVVTCLDAFTEYIKSIDIQVREPAEIYFEPDKQYTLPSVPVELRWNVTHCSKVTLENNEVANSGTMVVSPIEDKQYTLVVEDDFGKIKETVSIHMLPLPIVNSIIAPFPKIERNVSISYNLPQFKHEVTVPIVETEFCKLKMPFIPDLKDSGYYVERIKISHRSLSKLISQFISKIFRLQSI